MTCFDTLREVQNMWHEINVFCSNILLNLMNNQEALIIINRLFP